MINRHCSILFMVLFSLQGLMAQPFVNTTLVGQLTYSERLSDVWGYVAADSTEYALVGTLNTVSIVDLSNPAQPIEVDAVVNTSTIWRDIKTWNDYAYVVADGNSVDGLLIIDLSTLPDSVTYVNYRPVVTIDAIADTLWRAHNIWIEGDYAYIAGSNLGNGGILIFDIAANPLAPVFMGAINRAYSHDIFVRGDTAWTADIWVGQFSAYDVSDKNNPVFLASRATSFNFTHNIWLSEDGQTLFTTDELNNAYVGAYDVSDLSNIEELDLYRPVNSLNQGILPHNVHVIDDWVSTSYYSEGIIILDGHRPENLVKIASFDTQLAWGAYPFLPSGLTLVSDIHEGLYIIQPNYVRACYLEGKVTDAATGFALNGVVIDFQNIVQNTTSDFSGDYKTGWHTAGAYEVTFSLTGYHPQTITVNLNNGQVTLENVALVPLQSFSLNGQVLDEATNNGIPNTQLTFKNTDFSYTATTDANGLYTIPNFYEGTYEVQLGRWGYQLKTLQNETFLPATSVYTLSMQAGYEDQFIFDLGWQVSGDAETGHWERGIPISSFGVTPANDVADHGQHCYITGNTDNLAIGKVSNGTTILTSPTFDLSNYFNPYLHYQVWFMNVDSSSFAPTANDSLKLFLSDGTAKILIDYYTVDSSNLAIAQNWRPQAAIKITDYMGLSAPLFLVVEATQDNRTPTTVVEAGLDNFFIIDSTTSTTHTTPAYLSLNIYPNPFSTTIVVEIENQDLQKQPQLAIYNALGQLQRVIFLNKTQQAIETTDWETGVYFLQLMTKAGKSLGYRMIKID